MVHEQYTNNLANEKSPYLLQHAHQSVNWFAWEEEAFEKAKKENKPIFLSIGYSTCHWCHVMARESFEDVDIASFLNKHYVAIKVDREERPDIDSIYMKVCQMMTGHGGWPLNIFMTPDQIPFYAGTYFPKTSKYGMPGFTDVISQLSDRYTSDPEHIDQIVTNVTHALARTVQVKSSHKLTSQHVDLAFNQLKKQFDSEHGGFGMAPKFPQPQNALFLLMYYQLTGNQTALAMTEMTLQAMGNGGIYDHIGFGFTRYATDEKWLVPHFEKMLYDNSLLLLAYITCFQVTKNPYYQQKAEQVITFLDREMSHPSGAFYSAIDADSEGVEGDYYLWDKEEIIDVLGQELGDLYAAVYGITPEGNFEGQNIPNRLETPPATVEIENASNQREMMLEKARKKLLAYREKRSYPHVDDKILTSWNAMAVSGLAQAGRIFGNETYIDMAKNALHFMEEKLVHKDRLMARYRDGETKHKAYLDDYAYLIWAYIELYHSTFSLAYLQQAKQLANTMIDLFWDNEHSGFYLSGKDAEKLIVPDKEVYDGALPSGNGVAGVMLTKLAYLTGETTYLDYVEEMYATFYEDIHHQASAAAFFVQSLLLTESPTKEVVVLGSTNDPAYQHFIQKLQQVYLPDTTLLVGEHPSDFKDIAPFVTNYQKVNNKTTVYICENFACQAPTTDLEYAYKSIINS